MKHVIPFALLVVVLASLCIGQQEQPQGEQEGWTVQDWKDHLTFINPPSGQDATSMIPVFRHADELPVGTHIVFQIESTGSIRGAPTSIDTTLDLTIAGRETINGIDCTVVDIAIEMEMESSGETLPLTIHGKEWVDANGIPVKVEEEVTMTISEFEIPMSLMVERTGEEVYQGHECWVFSGPLTVDIMGMTTEGSVTEYMDKESFQVIRVITEIATETDDTQYMEPPPSVEELEWELGGRETVKTPSGTYDCQVIYLKENNEVVGTIWVNEEIRVPVKYVATYKTEYMDMEVTMTLVEYTSGR